MVLRCFENDVNTTAALKCCTSRKYIDRGKLQPRTTGQTTSVVRNCFEIFAAHRLQFLEQSVIGNATDKAREKMKYHGAIRNHVPFLDSFLLLWYHMFFCYPFFCTFGCDEDVDLRDT